MSNLQHCLSYLQRQHVLTLCCSAGGDLWAANCFYCFDATRLSFYIMTECHTHHARLMLANPKVSGTVSDQVAEVSLLQGVQFSGIIQLLESTEEIAALSQYQIRFPIAHSRRAPLWELSLERLKMTDNRLGFGTKIIWQRDP